MNSAGPALAGERSIGEAYKKASQWLPVLAPTLNAAILKLSNRACPGGSPRRAVVDRPASRDGDKVERLTSRTTLSPSGDAASPCGARRGDPRLISEEGRGSGRSPEVFCSCGS
ncbi:hypothetical protein GCM10023176_00020 [Micromonospora coerulea]|uniref:Uncharacterized protein n=1 Tax=Micromonospora coerulea TaxID=47856 RepID=A0ABP8S3Y5_9ACTN